MMEERGAGLFQTSIMEVSSVSPRVPPPGNLGR